MGINLTVTMQEIFDHEGYVILASMTPSKVGDVREIHFDDDLAPRGTKLVVIGEATKTEARRYFRRYNLPGSMEWPHFLKVVIE
jgi:hypothetical protein